MYEVGLTHALWGDAEWFDGSLKSRAITGEANGDGRSDARLVNRGNGILGLIPE
ncbi:MAG: hypothetical protein NT069_11495 [Planctomycetota bacterium]|nr:hypothetical protein [Planctomycetota bacterium]